MPRKLRAFTTKGQEDVWAVVRRINEAWVKARISDLEALFHENMAIVDRDLVPLAKGRAACIASYGDFAARASIRDYKESRPEVDLYGETALARYAFEIRYELDGRTFHETGRDLFVFTRSEGAWRAVWRAVFIDQPLSAA